MKTQCPKCKAIVNAPSDSEGKKAKCPKCQAPFRITQIQTGESPDKVVTRKDSPVIETSVPKIANANNSKKQNPFKQNINTCCYCGHTITTEVSMLAKFACMGCLILAVLATIGWSGWLITASGNNRAGNTPIKTTLDIRTEVPERKVELSQNSTSTTPPVISSTNSTNEMETYLYEFASLYNEILNMSRLFRMYGMNIEYKDYMSSLMKMDASLPTSTPPDNIDARLILECAQETVTNFRKGKGIFVSEKLAPSTDEKMEDWKEASEALLTGIRTSLEFLNLWKELEEKYKS